MEPTQLLSAFCEKTTFADLPPAVVKIAKQTILDTLGCAVGTHSDEPEKPVVINKVVKDLGAGRAATLTSGAPQARWRARSRRSSRAARGPAPAVPVRGAPQPAAGPP